VLRISLQLRAASLAWHAREDQRHRPLCRGLLAPPRFAPGLTRRRLPASAGAAQRWTVSLDGRVMEKSSWTPILPPGKNGDWKQRSFVTRSEPHPQSPQIAALTRQRFEASFPSSSPSPVFILSFFFSLSCLPPFLLLLPLLSSSPFLSRVCPAQHPPRSPPFPLTRRQGRRARLSTSRTRGALRRPATRFPFRVSERIFSMLDKR
jgi:hypothetical protein